MTSLQRRVRQSAAATTGLLLSGIVLAACGGSSDDAAASASSTSSSAGATSSSSSSSAASTSAAAPTSAAAQQVPVPASTDGSTLSITEFPAPAGATVDPTITGGLLGGTWQFVVQTSSPDEVLDFYEATLPALGYTVSRNASIQQGGATVTYSMGFAGPTYGTIDENDLFGGVGVSVSDSPNGLVLDGAPVG